MNFEKDPKDNVIPINQFKKNLPSTAEYNFLDEEATQLLNEWLEKHPGHSKISPLRQYADNAQILREQALEQINWLGNLSYKISTSKGNDQALEDHVERFYAQFDDAIEVLALLGGKTSEGRSLISGFEEKRKSITLTFRSYLKKKTYEKS